MPDDFSKSGNVISDLINNFHLLVDSITNYLKVSGKDPVKSSKSLILIFFLILLYLFYSNLYGIITLTKIDMFYIYISIFIAFIIIMGSALWIDKKKKNKEISILDKFKIIDAEKYGYYDPQFDNSYSRR